MISIDRVSCGNGGNNIRHSYYPQENKMTKDMAKLLNNNNKYPIKNIFVIKDMHRAKDSGTVIIIYEDEFSWTNQR